MDPDVMVKALEAAKRILPGVKWGISGRRVYGWVAGTQVSIEWDSVRGWRVLGFTMMCARYETAEDALEALRGETIAMRDQFNRALGQEVSDA